MSSAHEFVIEPLNRNHNRTVFSCGIESLDRYLKRQAGQDMKRRVSRVFVVRSPEDERQVLGFYSLSALSIDLSVLPEVVAAKLPRHPVPAALIGRLAVDLSAQEIGIGKMLLADAIKRTLAVSDDIAIYAMVVDAINEQAKSFYERYGFVRLTFGDSRLFLPLRYL
ncbi:MAG: GNAT family N-acetyltransferase [Gammaproteobacteria bacterium]|jgi:ribosomal protein S18 acetylase RimI-like enzyme|nr:GNAT family N-acetyltransferase [Gammaproteobacteria bacterium]